MLKNILFFMLLISAGFNLRAQDSFYNVNKVRDIRLYFYEPGWQQLLDSLFEADQNERILASVTIDGIPFDSVGVRYKGYSSVNVGESKNPLNIDLDYIIQGQDYDGNSKLKLSNVLHDPSFLREVLTYEVARKYMPASQANYAMVYANDTLIGLYTNVQPVNKDFTEQYFGSRNHSFFKGNPAELEYPFGSNANLQYYGEDTVSYAPYYSLESDYGWADLVQLIRMLDEAPDSIEQILDVDRTLWMLALDYSLVNLDSYIAYAQNYYLYLDDNHRFQPVLWDLNMSFGSFRLSDGSYGALTGGLTVNQVKNLNPLGILTYAASPRPLITGLLQNDSYKRMFLAHMRTIMDENVVSGEILSRGAEIQSIIDSCVQLDPNKFYSYNDFINNLNTTVGGSNGMIQYPGIGDLMQSRNTYLNTLQGFSNEPEISDIALSPSNPEIGVQVFFTARITNADSLFFACRYGNNVFSKFQMYDDGNHGDGTAADSVFGISVTIGSGLFQYYYYAENSVAGTFSPARAEYEYYSLIAGSAPPDLVINELMADNISIATDQDGEYDDWIEIYNNSAQAISLSGYFISDNPDNPQKWAFPDTVIEADSYIIVWADNDSLQAGLHTSFKLSKLGEYLVLAAGDSIVDSVNYTVQNADASFGRYPNGSGSFITMNHPTFSENNLSNSVQEYTIPFDVVVFPNPAYERVNILCNNMPAGKTEIRIYNQLGKQVISQTYDNSNTSGLYEADVSGLNPGIYFLIVQTKTTVISRKIIII